MICNECKKESKKEYVCTNCGLVLEDRPIIAIPKRNYNHKVIDNGITPFSPNIRFQNIHSFSSCNKDLNGAFRRTAKKEKKDRDWKYLSVYENLKTKCSALQLPDVIFKETLNLYLEIVGKTPNFFRMHSLEASLLAFIKIACKIHDFTILDNEIQGNTKKINRAFFDTQKVLKFRLKQKEKPKYIDYICGTLGNPPHLLAMVHENYQRYKKYFNSANKIEGYVLGIVYMLYNQKPYMFGGKITYGELGKIFKTSPLTISRAIVADYKERVLWRGSQL
jgi:transcription initiation factor TFIIIB Brf1 subunit/transcription initiation factor TFIIB